MNTTSQTITMTYAEEQALKAAKKEENAWRRTMRDAKVYGATRRDRLQTVSMAADEVLRNLVKHAEEMVSSARPQLEKFAAAVTSDPVQALEWNHDEFDMAGDLKAASHLLAQINGCLQRGGEYDSPSTLQIIRWVRRDLFEEVLRAARSPARSSSATSNEMEKAVTKGRAKLLERLERMIEFRNVGL
jgi:hypothetical protein